MTRTPTAENSATQFVRYAPEVDALSAHFDEDLEAVAAGVEQYVASSVAGEGTGRAVRFAHAKGYGLVRPRSTSSTACCPNMPKASTRLPDTTMR